MKEISWSYKRLNLLFWDVLKEEADVSAILMERVILFCCQFILKILRRLLLGGFLTAGIHFLHSNEIYLLNELAKTTLVIKSSEKI